MSESEKKFRATLDSLNEENRKLRRLQFQVDGQLAAVKMLLLETVDYLRNQLEKLVSDARLALSASKSAANAARNANPTTQIESSESAERASTAAFDRAMEMLGYLGGLAADPACPV